MVALLLESKAKSRMFKPFYSMGGAVAVHVAAKKVLPSLAGLVVVDVVEVCSRIKDLLIIFLVFENGSKPEYNFLKMVIRCNIRGQRWLH